MKEKRECKLVQDLLPNYIEQVTSEETNQYIQEHLQSCAECTQVYTSMTREIKSKALDTDKTVDYMKKVNQKMKIAKMALGSIAIIILLVMLAFWANTLRNYRILEELSQTLKETQKTSNYHMSMSNKLYNCGILVQDVYRKEEKGASIIQIITTTGDKDKQSYYYTKDKSICYREGNMASNTEGEYEKTVEIDESYQFGLPEIGNWFLLNFEEGAKSKLWFSMRTKIEKTIYDGKECYVIENDRFSKDPNEYTIYYIEKSTAVVLKQINGTNHMDYNYEFGNVDDKVFIEPNIEEYELIEK